MGESANLTFAGEREFIGPGTEKVLEPTNSGTSVFDPVVCELVYRWFSPPGGLVLDPFAGGSVRGIVAAYLGRRYRGIELRQKQIDANEMQVEQIIYQRRPMAPAPFVAKSTAGAPAWQRGYELAALKAIKTIFDEHDRGYAHGEFSRVREAQIADWLAEGSLQVRALDGRPVAAIVRKGARAGARIDGFNGDFIAELSAGDAQIKRVAFLPGRAGVLLPLLAGETRAAAEIFQEHPEDRALMAAAGFGWGGSKIRASSDIIGVYFRGLIGANIYDPAELRTLSRLRLPEDEIAAAVDRFMGRRLSDPRTLPWAAHYSSYNKGKTWWALALRSFGGDPAFIEKPAEMSKKWKAENPDKLGLRVMDTPLRADLPELEPLIAMVPGKKERIRLMRLDAGKGELARHADITDPDAGVAPGKLMRIHIPLVTNDAVRFEQWDLKGRRLAAHMAVGTAWYLDTRKPHTAVNMGTSDRVHLVMDVESNPELLALLGDDAPTVGGGGPTPELDPIDSTAFEIAPAAPAAPSALEPEADFVPEFTPVECHDGIWFKRDDLFCIAGVRGGKVRTCWALAQGAAGLVTASHRVSPQVNIVAQIGRRLGVPVRVHTPEGPNTPEMDAAETAGATIIRHPAGFNNVIIARAREDAEATGFTEIPFGMECDAAVQANRAQVPNVPAEAKRLVVVVGSGMSLAGILWGLVDTGRKLPVLGVMVGADPIKRLEQYAPSGWRDMVELVRSPLDYHTHAPNEAYGLKFDPIYEAKCLPYLQAGDCMWMIGIRSDAGGAAAAPDLVEAPIPEWVLGDAIDAPELLPGEYDLVFSCPPYGDLEVYSDDPRDLSAMEFDAMLAKYRAIIAASCSMLKKDRFAAFVVGDYRDAGGNYRNFISHTIAAFLDAGLTYYNQAILITAAGSLPIRVRQQFETSRKLGNTHQYVLVFLKGDAKRAAAAFGPVRVAWPEEMGAPDPDAGATANGLAQAPDAENGHRSMMADLETPAGTRWQVSAAWLSKKHNCTLAGIQAKCGARCCYGPIYWPARSYGREDFACGNLGPAGCTLAPGDKPVKCHLYPLMINGKNKLILHQRTMFETSCCRGNFGEGPPLIEALESNLTALFGAEQYARVRADVLAGRDSYFDVSPEIAAAVAREEAWEAANERPVPRSQFAGSGAGASANSSRPYESQSSK